jgi:hypothetical protein
MRRLSLFIALGFVIALSAMAGVAQAVVVTGPTGQFGLAMVAGTRSTLSSTSFQPVTSAPPCTDPWLTSDLNLASYGLCWHSGGSVMHSNEPFALTWDLPTPNRRYWQTTRQYVEQFLRDVADGSGTLTSPYAVTPQYNDPGGRAQNASTYGGGCIDLGVAGGFTCDFGVQNGTGHDYPASICTPSGVTHWYLYPNGSLGDFNNDKCLTDAQIRAEVSAASTQIQGKVKPGYTPVVVVLLPPGVNVCLDSGQTVCSADSTAPARFCSYHSQVNGLAYVVQPWTAFQTGCDEPDVPALPNPPPQDLLAKNAGQRLVSPISQSHMAAITNPMLNGWYALDGSEVNDNNGCHPLANQLDNVTVGNSAQNPYWLQREWNNAGAIESDPNALGCTPHVLLAPNFVVPSAVRPGDVVELDGSTTVSTLIVPKGSYHWDFGDGSTAVGPSIAHSYSKGGNYTVRLTVTDRGGYIASVSQTINVLGANGQVVAPTGSSGGFHARAQLMPQSLRSVLRSGMTLRLTSNEKADGFTTLLISRHQAKQAHLKAGHKRVVVIGRGTISRIRHGTMVLHVHVPASVARKLHRLHRLTITLRLNLVGQHHEHLTLVVAGRY